MKNFVAGLTAFAITTSLVAPAFAGGAEDSFRNTSSVRAGFYLHLPFAGGLKPARDTGLSYGFTMGLGMSFAQNSFMDPRRQFRADMLKLSFSTRGFDTLAVGGQSILDRNTVWFGAADGDDDEGRSPWDFAILGVGAIALGVVLFAGGEKKCGGGPVFEGGFCNPPDPPPPPPQ